MEIKLSSASYLFTRGTDVIVFEFVTNEYSKYVSVRYNSVEYYKHLVDTFDETQIADSEAIQRVIECMSKDRNRWSGDCYKIIYHFDEFFLTQREITHTAMCGDTKYTLMAMLNDEMQFILRFSNSKNNDVLSCCCEAPTYTELLSRVKMYAGVIEEIAGVFITNSEALLDGAFQQSYFRR